MTVVEKLTLQGAGCGKAARPVLKRGLPRKGQVYSTTHLSVFGERGEELLTLPVEREYTVIIGKDCGQLFSGKHSRSVLQGSIMDSREGTVR